MDIPTAVLGVFGLIYGLVTIILRFFKPGFFKKLEPMKNAYGELVGSIIHIIFYTMIPIVLGFVCLYLGLNGKSIF